MIPKKLFIGLTGLVFLMLASCSKDQISYEAGARLKSILLYSSPDDDRPISIESEYEYDSQGRISRISSPMYDDGKIVGTISYDLYEYNSEDQLVKICNYNANLNSPTGFINLKNYFYTYSEDGKKEKELIEYPLIGSSEYTLYKYSRDKLIKAEMYGPDGILEYYTVNDYNRAGQLSKETRYGSDNKASSYIIHHYLNGLNTESETFSTHNGAEAVRRVKRTYDKNDNLITLETVELSPLSSAMSYVLKYIYFE